MTMLTGPLLVVEDVPNILDFLEMTLKFKGYEVMKARNGKEALDSIQKSRPALLITDILMPKMDGFSLLYHLRADPATRDMPVVFLSATYIAPDDKAFAMRIGATRFIEKPIDTEDFLLTVAELLTQGSAPPPPSLNECEFFTGYRKQLEMKLQQKSMQIARAERLIETLPPEQKPGFVNLRQQSISDRDEIQAELEQIKILLEKNNSSI